MLNDNYVSICGNLTSDLELRFTQSGSAVVNFSVAVNKSWIDKKTNEKKQDTSFFKVTCWRELAENAAESLVKGDRVWVVGNLEQRSWETQEGDKRSVVEISATDVAPSLRFATAQVQKVQRTEPGNRREEAAEPNGNRREPARTGGRGGYEDYGSEPF